MIIKDLLKEHPRIYEKIKERTLEQRMNFDDSFNISKYSSGYGFDWSISPEGRGFWESISQEQFQVFYEKYPEVKSKSEDLSGRYLKALVNRPQFTDFKKGEYIEILKKAGSRYSIPKGFGANYPYPDWELMPEGFDPSKIVEEVEEWIPKVGEWCYYLGKESGGIDTGSKGQGLGWYKGIVARFVKQQGDSYSFDKTNSKMESCSNYAKAFRKALPHEIPSITSETETIQTTPKKWSKGTYGLLLNRYKGFKAGLIDVIIDDKNGTNQIRFEKFKSYNIVNLEWQSGAEMMWFATKREAEEYWNRLQEGDKVHKELFENKPKDPIKELLEEAKLRFPIGTKFIAPDNGCTYTVKSYDRVEKNNWYRKDHLIINVEECSGSGQYLYYRNKWAEIISSPIPKESLLVTIL